MKKLAIWTLAVAMLLTLVEPVLAQSTEAAGSSSLSMEEVREPRLSDLGMKLNPQLGVSSFEYSGKNAGEAKQKLSGGVTVEFGASQRKLETGLVVLQTQGSTLLTLPMMAKLRVLSMRAQSWYGKFGFMPAFEISSSRKDTNNIDVLGSIGAGGRLMFNQKSDFIIEATYNRGLMDGLRGGGENYNQGFLVMAGMSFNI